MQTRKSGKPFSHQAGDVPMTSPPPGGAAGTQHMPPGGRVFGYAAGKAWVALIFGP